MLTIEKIVKNIVNDTYAQTSGLFEMDEKKYVNQIRQQILALLKECGEEIIGKDEEGDGIPKDGYDAVLKLGVRLALVVSKKIKNKLRQKQRAILEKYISSVK